MLRPLVFIASIFVSSCEPSDSFTARHIPQIEAQIEMPPGAASIEEYARFCSSSGSHVIKGEYVSQGLAAIVLENSGVRRRIGTAIYIVDEDNMPSLMDGGCSVLTLSYDTSDGILTGPACNGIA